MARTKPASFPQWASDASGNATANQVVAPGGTKMAAGWGAGEKPPNGFMNWLHWLVFNWILFFNDLQEQGFTASGSMGAWTQPHDFQNAVTIEAVAASGNSALVAQGDGAGHGVFGKTGASPAGNGVRGLSGGAGAGLYGQNTSTGFGGQFLGGSTGAGNYGVSSGGGGTAGGGGFFQGSGTGDGLDVVGGAPVAGTIGGYGIQISTTGQIGLLINRPAGATGVTGAHAIQSMGLGTGAGAFLSGDNSVAGSASPGSPGAICTSFGQSPGCWGISDGNGPGVKGSSIGSGVNTFGGQFIGGSAAGVSATGGTTGGTPGIVCAAGSGSAGDGIDATGDGVGAGGTFTGGSSGPGVNCTGKNGQAGAVCLGGAIGSGVGGTGCQGQGGLGSSQGGFGGDFTGGAPMGTGLRATANVTGGQGLAADFEAGPVKVATDVTGTTANPGSQVLWATNIIKAHGCVNVSGGSASLINPGGYNIATAVINSGDHHKLDFTFVRHMNVIDYTVNVTLGVPAGVTIPMTDYVVSRSTSGFTVQLYDHILPGLVDFTSPSYTVEVMISVVGLGT